MSDKSELDLIKQLADTVLELAHVVANNNLSIEILTERLERLERITKPKEAQE